MKTKLLIISALKFLLAMPVSSAMAAEASSVATANENILVNTAAQVSLTLTPVTSILASTYQSGTVVASWNATTTAGSLAFRLNPSTMASTSTSPFTGTATSTTNSNNKIPVRIISHSGASCTLGATTVIDGWSVCPQGLGDAIGSIRTTTSQSISVGTYPLSMDAAVWAY